MSEHQFGPSFGPSFGPVLDVGELSELISLYSYMLDNDGFDVVKIFQKYSEKYYFIGDETENGIFLRLKDKDAEDIIHTVSFAELNDQDGVRFHIEYTNKLTYDFLTDIFIDFGISREVAGRYIIWDEETFETLVENDYFIQFHNKYYHFVVAIDFQRFELESKGVTGGIFEWTHMPEIKNKASVVYNISTTGDHMWNDQYSLKCSGCFVCNDESDNDESDED